MTASNGTVNAAYMNRAYAGAVVDTFVGTMTLNAGTVVNFKGEVTVGFAGKAPSQGGLNVNIGTVLNASTINESWMVVN
jgi:hypothetical protein